MVAALALVIPKRSQESAFVPLFPISVSPCLRGRCPVPISAKMGDSGSVSGVDIRLAIYLRPPIRRTCIENA
jgi:hypothetical protein